MGKVPAIVHRGVVITEVAAICCYLAEAFPAAGLAPPIGDAQRGTYLRWLFFEPAHWNPRSSTGCWSARPAGPGPRLWRPRYDDGGGGASCDARALSARRAFLTADVLIGSALRWGTMVGCVPQRPEFAAYIEGLNARPALQRAQAQDEELAAGQSAELARHDLGAREAAGLLLLGDATVDRVVLHDVADIGHGLAAEVALGLELDLAEPAIGVEPRLAARRRRPVIRLGPAL